MLQEQEMNLKRAGVTSLHLMQLGTKQIFSLSWPREQALLFGRVRAETQLA